MLEQLFGSESRAKIIKHFCTHPGEKYYLRELARSLDIKLNALSRELDNLQEIGFLVSAEENNHRYIQVNKDFPLLTELKALIIKSTVLLEKAVVQKVRNLRGVQVFLLTGMFVNEDTGTDMLLVGSVDRKRVQKMIEVLSKSFYQDIRFTLMTTAEYRYRLDVTDKFVYQILGAQPITIINKVTPK